jgi:iron complex outermembrane receptor protein
MIGVASLVGLAATAQPVPALAENRAAPAVSGTPDTPPEPDADDASSLPDVIVTARRRAEDAARVPAALSVIGGDLIDRSYTVNTQQLSVLVPTLNYSSANPRNTAFTIRGLGSSVVAVSQANDGLESGVGFYVDQVYHGRPATAAFDFADIEQIEVLRGPQGSLYGKNTTAGAINVTSRQPEFDFGGRFEASLGNLDFRQLKAALTGPLSDTLAARLAVSYTQRDGTLFNAATDRRINNQDNLGLRGQLLWTPGGGATEVTLAGDYSTQNPECCGAVYVRTGATQRALNRQYAALAAAQGYAVPSTNPFDRITDLDAQLSAGNKIGGASLRVKAPLGKGTFTSITAWRFWDWVPASDRDFVGLPITTKSQNPSQQNQYTQEFRYAQSGDHLDFQVGLFGFYQTVRTQGLQEQGAAASKWLIAPSSALSNDPTVLDGLTATNDIRFDNASAAAYGQATWKVTDRFHIQPGLRLNYDNKKGHYSSVVTDGQGNLVVFSPTNTSRQLAQLAVLPPQTFDARFSSWNLSGDLTLTYDVARDVHAYATYARSFKSGGINLNGVPADAAGNPLLAAATVKPERINHFELGLKTQFWERRGTLNLAAFRTDVGNFQALVQNGQLGVLRGYLANAEKVRTQGVEAEFSLRPSERFNLYANGAYTDAKYVRFADAPCPPELSGGGSAAPIAAAGTPGNSPASCDISGQPLPGVSKWAFSWGVEGNVPVSGLGRDGQVYLGADGSYRSRWSSNPSPSAYTWVDGYALVNLRAGVRGALASGQTFDLFGWVRNAFDAHYFDQLQVQSGNTGLIVGNSGDPRTYGVTVKTVF